MFSSRPKVIAILPARLGSTRLPRKPLLELGGRPLIVQVLERVRACKDPFAPGLPLFDEVHVATDSAEIADVVAALGVPAWMTPTSLRSGTARVAFVARELDAKLVVNVQGDEPFVDASVLSPIVLALIAGADIATAAVPLFQGEGERSDIVKVVYDSRGDALYFSRAAIPGDRHLGIYGFQAPVLRRLLDLPRGALAAAEDLEQLDWLAAGERINVVRLPAEAASRFLSIDRPEDLQAARRRLDELDEYETP